MKNSILVVCFFFTSIYCYSQTGYPPDVISQGVFKGVTIPLRDLKPAVPIEANDGPAKEVPNNLRSIPKSNPNALPLGDDPLVIQNKTFRGPEDLLLSFDGIARFEAGDATPPDPTGAAGPNHYVHACNFGVKIFDKDGNIVLNTVLLGDFFGNGITNGDPIVMYDHLADRWLVSQFYIAGDALQIAISTTEDPTGTYNLYEFTFGQFPDYPKYSIWPNAYLMTTNKGGFTAYALERDEMLDPAGGNPQILGFPLEGIVENPNAPFGSQASNLLGIEIPANAPGYFAYIQDDSWNGVSFDHIKLWEVNLDWETPSNSMISQPFTIPTDPYETSFFPFGTGDVTQPGTNQRLDVLGGLLSYMANYRSFASHNSLLINFSVDVGGDRSGIRWIELRNVDNGPFSLYQEGTWSLSDNNSRFFGSMAMDINGNIALAYNIGGPNTFAGIRFTGRLDGDPLGSMSFEEQIIQEGGSFQSNSNRFGDYSQMTMDPDGLTFWFTGEYIKNTNLWSTKIAAFNLDDLPALGLDESTTNSNLIKIYPIDGANSEITVSDTEDIENLHYRIFDIKGELNVTGNFNKIESGHSAKFSRANLSFGVYLLEVYDNSKFKKFKKFLID